MSNDSPLSPVKAPFEIVDDFLPNDIAEAMRLDIDNYFARPYEATPQTHEIWNYWFVPGLYVYLRTSPEKVISRSSLDRFASLLKAWSAEVLGMIEISWPCLSLYVAGCRQVFHNDASNGRFAYVYSLSRNQRQTSGGETLVMHEGDLFRDNIGAPPGGSFYSAIEPRFNRLIVFDDRMPHAVERVDGSMDPIEGRFVLHGHMREAGAIVAGHLSREQVASAVLDAVLDFSAEALARIKLYHGLLVLRFVVTGEGNVRHCRVVVDRVTGSAATDSGRESLISNLMEKIKALQFPVSQGDTTVTQPILFAGEAFGPRS